MGYSQGGAMIEISNLAAKQICLLKSQEEDSSAFLRVSVIGGGCSGMSYKMKFDTQASKEDNVFEDKGVKLVTDPKSYLYLAGTVLDFDGGLNGQGFSFNNPNASKTCGCGASFSV